MYVHIIIDKYAYVYNCILMKIKVYICLLYQSRYDYVYIRIFYTFNMYDYDYKRIHL